MPAVVSLGNLDGTSKYTPNPGGVRTLYVVMADDIANNWPMTTDVVGGEIVNMPVMVTGKKFAEYQCPDGTIDINSQLTGDPGYMGYKHTIGFSFAGMSKELIVELSKHRNSGSLYLFEMNDGQFGVLGSSMLPIFLKSDLKIGKKGSDKRGFDLKGEQDGLMLDITPLKATLVSAIPLL